MAEVYHNNIIDIDLESGTLFRSFLNQTIGSGDNNANWYGVRVFRKGEPIALSGCSVQGLFMPASGAAILISDGTHTWVSGNEAAVLLPQACYNVKGRFTLTIKIIGTNSYSITDTVRIIDGVVADTYSANPVAPTAAVPTYQEILAVYDQMVAAKDGSVRFDIEQELTAAQMTQARGNIEAASAAEVSDLKSALNNLVNANSYEKNGSGPIWKAYNIISGHKYRITNTSPSGACAIWSTNTYGSMSENIQTFSEGITYNQTITVTATADADYFFIYFNTNGQTNSIVIEDVSLRVPMLELRMNEAETNIDTLESAFGNEYNFDASIINGIQLVPTVLNNVYIDETNNVLSNTSETRMVYCRVYEGLRYLVRCKASSIKKIAFSNALTTGSSVYSVQVVSGMLDKIVHNTEYKYLVIQLFTASDEDQVISNYTSALNIYEDFSANDKRVGLVTERFLIDNPQDTYKLAIDPNEKKITDYQVGSNRTIFVPVKANTWYHVTCNVSSTKRAGFVDDIALDEDVSYYAQYTGELDFKIYNYDSVYLCIQLFTNDDTEQDVSAYINALHIYEGITAVDQEARSVCETVPMISETVSQVSETVSQVSETILYEKPYMVINNCYIDDAEGLIKHSATNSLIVYPVLGIDEISIRCSVSSTKKIALANNYTPNAEVHNIEIISGVLHKTFAVNNYAFIVIQPFTVRDENQDIDDYTEDITAYHLTAVDLVARSKANTSRYFYTENLTGLPILENMDDIEIVTAAYADSEAFHLLVKDMCDNSNGYLTQHYMGEDAHENKLYYYKTHPVELIYGANREATIPSWPIDGGNNVKPFRVIYTTNIHADEHNGNWVIYNLIYKILHEESQMLKFFRNNVEIIWIPYICPTGKYENVDGQNVNRSFPISADGECTCPEAALVKEVFDEYGAGTDLHIDVHTFPNGTVNSSHFATWIFTDSEKLGMRAVRVTEDVLEEYRKKHPSVTQFQKGTGAFTNILTTSSTYMQTVYGCPAGTIEGEAIVGGNPTGTDAHTSATAYLYDFITQCTIAMVR